MKVFNHEKEEPFSQNWKKQMHKMEKFPRFVHKIVEEKSCKSLSAIV